MYKYRFALWGYEYPICIDLSHEYQFTRENLGNYLIQALKHLKDTGVVKKDKFMEYCEIAQEVEDYLVERKGFTRLSEFEAVISIGDENPDVTEPERGELGMKVFYELWVEKD